LRDAPQRITDIVIAKEGQAVLHAQVDDLVSAVERRQPHSLAVAHASQASRPKQSAERRRVTSPCGHTDRQMISVMQHRRALLALGDIENGGLSVRHRRKYPARDIGTNLRIVEQGLEYRSVSTPGSVHKVTYGGLAHHGQAHR
jgi:hypothetical protein